MFKLTSSERERVRRAIVNEICGEIADDGCCPQTPHTHDLTGYGFGSEVPCQLATAVKVCAIVIGGGDDEWLASKVSNPW